MVRETRKRKRNDDEVMLVSCDVIFFFFYLWIADLKPPESHLWPADLKPFESQIPDAWFMNFTFTLIVTFYLTKPEKRTKISVTQLLHYCFE